MLMFRVALGTVGDIENNVPSSKEEQEAPATITSATDKIVGTTTAMEYATSKDATVWTTCTDGNTVVKAGTYYVRFKETDKKKASAPIEVVIEEKAKDNQKVDSIIDSKTTVGKVSGLESVYKTLATENNKGFTAADKAVVDAGGSSSIYLKASPILSETTGVKSILDTMKLNGHTKGLGLDLSVVKELTDVNSKKTTTNLIELPNIINVSLSIPTELQGKKSYNVYRYHEGKIDILSMTKNDAGEYIKVSEDGKTVVLNIKYFSDYVLGYKDTSIVPPNTNVVSPSATTPKTSDTTSTMMFFGLITLSMLGVMIYRKKDVE